ncbi:Rgg/GadR/MutR family transcriptional regulator [Lacticaseibacillus sharpeae]|uniref:Rgg/GadR/MutR family transcriptional regulator n=1 Tax=Lacticaseibacillus sharpeae TaxID=1626 RepID=UPI0006D29F67|nr:Rgg/GadR/MutR family transcriptional regulator [Lacticaseibacillus sharpeae]
MRHGELIQELRKERNITQIELANGINHRSTLASFENNGAKVDFESMMKYLDRMNISVEEYEYIYNSNTTPEKTKSRELFKKLFCSNATNPSHQHIFTQSMYTRFNNSKDFFYYALYAQSLLIESNNQGNLDPTSPLIKSVQINIKKHLNEIQTWGHFEVALFTNCLFIFDTDFVTISVDSALKRSYFYSNSAYYSQDIKALIANLLIYSATKNMPSLFTQVFNRLKSLSTLQSDIELNLYKNIFFALPAPKPQTPL